MRRSVHLVLALGVAVPVLAQDTTRAPRDTGRVVRDSASVSRDSATGALRNSPVACVGQVIRRVDVHAGYPIAAGELERFPMLLRLQNKVHTPTRPEVVLPFLLLREGDRCEERRRAESERLLRTQPYIAQARVQAMDAGDGGVILDVSLVDEFAWTVRVSMQAKSSYLRRVSGGNTNINGSGISLVGGFASGGAYRDEWQATASSFQMNGEPLFTTMTVARRRMGGEWGVVIGVPFLTDFQRVAWRMSVGQTDAYLPFARPDTEPVWLGLRRINADVGILARFGTPGSLYLAGFGLSRELAQSSTQPLLIRGTGVVADTSTAVLGRYGTLDARRIDVILGLRRLRFTRTSGFEVLEGTEDVALGVQAGLVASRGLPEIGADERDVFLSGDLYFGRGDAFHFLRADARVQGRRADVGGRWDGVLWDASVTAYWRVGLARTIVASGIWTGGYRSTVPFQLTLGDQIGGVRGFVNSQQAGGERLALRIEDRNYLGRVFGVAAVGFAPFLDVGVMGARDVPYGASSSPAVALGLSLLGTVPPASRRLWRLDVTYRVTGDNRAPLWTIGTTVRDGSRFGFQEPPDLERSRTRAIAPSRYSWP